MKYFKLPDLGEGLVEAEIVSWHVRPGALVTRGDALLSVETAKAMVEIPSPVSGEIVATFGQPGDIIPVGKPLVEYKEEIGAKREDPGTVVGNLASGGESVLKEDNFTIGNITQESNLPADTGEVIKGVRRAMAKNLSAAHAQVAKVTIHEDADIYLWDSQTDITIKLIHAIAAAVKAEPVLNSWFNAHAMRLNTQPQIDLGIAVDTPEGLFVPVLRNIQHRTGADLRSGLDRLRSDVRSRSIPAGEMKNPTITLSNFGTIAGKYGDPVIVPPTVCIVGAGKIREAAVAFQGKVAIHPILPLSVSFDHRVITGGEAARFLKALLADLESARGAEEGTL